MFKPKRILSVLSCMSLLLSCWTPSYAMHADNANSPREVTPAGASLSRTGGLELRMEDFSDPDYTAALWQTQIFNTAGRTEDNSDAVTLQDYSIGTQEDGNRYLNPPVGSKYKSPVVMTYKDENWPYQTLTSLSLRFRAFNQNGGYGSADSNPAFFPFYLPAMGDHTEGSYIGIQFATLNGKLLMRHLSQNKYVTISNTSWLVEERDGLLADGWADINLTYDYSSWVSESKLNITYTVTDRVGTSKSATVTYTVVKGSTAIGSDYFKVGIGSCLHSVTGIYDDFNPVFTTTQRDYPAQYLSRHQELFSLTVWSQEKLPLLQSAAAGFLGLDDDSQLAIVNGGYISYLNDLTKGSEEASAAEKFRADWKKVLELNAVTPEDSGQILQAISAYGALDEVAKLLLAVENCKLQSFGEELDIIRSDDDLSPFDITFDDGLNPFVNDLQDEYETFRMAADPLDENNTVLEIGGKQSAYVLKYWPTYGAMKSLSFRLYAPKTNMFTPWRAMVYTDPGNYYAFRSIDIGNIHAVMAEQRVDYVGASNQDNNSTLNQDGWITYHVMFTDTAMMITATDSYKNTYSWSGSYSPGGKFGFGFFHTENQLSRTAMVDDIHIEFDSKPGDFDVDDTPVDISAYFTGNVFLNPNETLEIQGNKLAATVEKVFIQRLADGERDKIQSEKELPGVIAQTAFDTRGSTEGIRGRAAAPQWLGTGKEANILQRSSTAINAVIPGELEKGVYAVKLTAAKAAEGASDVVLYVNRPDISFVTGDEGDVATQGGSFRIIGSNLAPTGSGADVTVKLVDPNGDVFILPVTKIYEDDAYSLEVAVPEGFAKGDYEVYVHNGYGDDTAWSLPKPIIVGDSPRASWPSTVFNVMDFGAVGDGLANDTPAIVSALSAAADNGGGVVYLPKGVYSVVTTLAIPERVTLKGDGDVNTVIRWQAWRWQYKELPNTLLSVIGNVEIRDLGIQGTRVAGVIKCYRATSARFVNDGRGDNIYVSNVSMRFVPGAGYVSEGGNGGWSTEAMTRAEILALVMAESGGAVQLDFRGATNNLQLDGMRYEIQSGFTNNMTNPTMRIWGRQVQVRNSYWVGYSLCTTSYGALIEDNDLEAAGFNPSGNGFYFARNYAHDAWANNRELLTTDGTALSSDVQIRFVGDDPELMQKYFGTAQLDGTAYIFTSNRYNTPLVEGYDVIVTSGQGLGQTRIITDTKNVKVLENGKEKEITTFHVDSPFTVTPNRKSRVQIYEPRVDMYFINNIFREGAASGSYGTMINTVWDGNEFSRHEGQYFDVHWGSLWYLTLKNQLHYEPIYMHGEGWGAEGSIAHQVNSAELRACLRSNTDPSSCAIMGFTMRDCVFDGYGYSLGIPSNGDGLSGFVMENCTFKERETAIYFTSASVGALTAVLLRNNSFETDNVFDSKYTDTIIYGDGANALNRQGYRRVVVENSGYTQGRMVLGDVNLDGKVSLKDSTMIRYYVLGRITLTDEQLRRADCDENGEVTLKDASIVRYWLLSDFGDYNDIGGSGGSSETPSGPTTDTGSGWIEGDF